ncbi:MAG TPA: amidohydrolase family protein [Acidimicrobiales bacterium]|nr:amidohydrolase family protein [Acidimicrobiales bacterium]
MGVVIRRADVDGSLRDIRIERGTIAEVATTVAHRPDDDVIDAHGGAAIPGLHDHHIHLLAWAAAERSIVVGPPDVADPNGFAEILRGAVPGGDGWLRAIGYHESVAGELDRHVLDRLVPERPLRLQHRSGVLWVLNTAALDLLGARDDDSPGIERGSDGVPTGRLWRMDSWLGKRLKLIARPEPPAAGGGGIAEALAGLSREAAARGVTGWTDATPGRAPDETLTLCDAVESRNVLQRLHLMLPPEADEPTGRTTRGPVKVMLDDPSLPRLEELSGLVSSAGRAGRAVAVHCVTRSQLALAVAAFDEAAFKCSSRRASGRECDRIEHGAEIPPGYLQVLAERGITVVTQPNFVFERGDQYLEEVDPQELPDLWRARSLVEAGIPVAAGTDAPFGSPDPWLAVRASIRRQSRSGHPVGAEEALDWRTALGLWLGSARDPSIERTVARGQPADVVVLDGPLPAALDGHEAVPVRATLIGGDVAFHA